MGVFGDRSLLFDSMTFYFKVSGDAFSKSIVVMVRELSEAA